MNLLEVKNLKVHFPSIRGPMQAVRGVEFTINHGEVVGMVGESGCGKSVTAQALIGLVDKGGQISGEVLLEGENILSHTNAQMQTVRGKKIGMIFQDPGSSLNPTMRIGKQIMEGILLHERLGKAEAYEKTVQLLHRLGINEPVHRMNQFPHELSGGMKQRILIAVSLACSPQLLIADEPTTALDVTIQAQILELLKQIQEERRLSLLLITHDLGVVAAICNRVIVMYAGRIIEEGPVDRILSDPIHPYTRALLTAGKTVHNDRNKSLCPIPGNPPGMLRLPNGCSFAPRCPSVKEACKEIDPELIAFAPGRRAACKVMQEKIL